MRSRRLSSISASLGVWLLVSCCFHKISDDRLFLRGPSISGAGWIQNAQTGEAARELFLNPSTISPSFLLGVGISENIRNAKLYYSFITEGYSYTQKEYNSISYLNINSNENTIVSITKENSLSPMGSLIKYSCEVMSVCIH